MRSISAILVVGLLLSGSAAQARAVIFKGGILEALTAEVPDNGQPASTGHFVPGLARENPPSAARQAKIDAMLGQEKVAYERTKDEGSPDRPGIQNPGEDYGRFSGRLMVQCRVEHPFELNELERRRVRIGVACGDRLTQFFLFTFSGDEISDAEVVPANVPNLGS
jgi:hypothetical protein